MLDGRAGRLPRGIRLANKPSRARAPALKLVQQSGETRDAQSLSDVSTLAEMLSWQAEALGDQLHLRLWRGEDDEELLTFKELAEGARAVAHGLREKGLAHGERVAIMLPTELDYFFAYFGILLAGGVPVPLYPPFRRAQLADHMRRQAGILRNAQASFLIASKEIRPIGVLLYGMVDDLRGVTSITELRKSGELAEPVPLEPGDTALIQYTSGSTGDPKGVVLSHYNLLSNIRAMGQALGATSADRFVSWLPLYHDMGLIGAWLGSLYHATPLLIMSPLTFLSRPANWLQAIHRHRATISVAPNFAFELCLRRIKDSEIEELDLSTLRALLNGAEPVSPSTIERFTERFSKYGFRAEALAPVYGLAECSVGLAFPPFGRLPVVERIDRHALSHHGVAKPVSSKDSEGVDVVACGQPLPGHAVRIVDHLSRKLPDRREGRLQFKGPSATKGYFRDSDRTAELFDGDWLETGDLAYMAAGDIFITGRVKDVIIKRGRNIYPHELEAAVADIEGVRRGCVAVFAAPDAEGGTEQLVVLAESRLTDREARERVSRAINKTSVALLGTPPDDIVIAPPHSVPKTSSGKLRRSAVRDLYLSGQIGRKDSPFWWQVTHLGVAGLFRLIRRWIRSKLGRG